MPSSRKIVNVTGDKEIRAVKARRKSRCLNGPLRRREDHRGDGENANPGVSEKELYGAMVHAMLANGGEL
jgi:hypothetical protein